MMRAEFQPSGSPSYRNIILSHELQFTIVIVTISTALFLPILSSKLTQYELYGVFLLSAISISIFLYAHASSLFKLRHVQQAICLQLRMTRREARQSQRRLAATRVLVQFSSAESKALRKNAMVLTQGLHLDHVLDVLLESVAE